MATSLNTGARNALVDAHGANSGALWFSMHSGDPGTTGANEIASCPRKLDSFPSAVAGETTSTGRVHDMPAGSDARFYGRWTASSGGTFHSGGPLPADEHFGVAGTYAHSLKIQAAASMA